MSNWYSLLPLFVKPINITHMQMHSLMYRIHMILIISIIVAKMQNTKNTIHNNNPASLATEFGAISPCEMNEFSDECEAWEAETGPYEKGQFMVKSNERTKGR